MNPQDAIDFSREAIKTCMLVGGPILVASLLIGLLVGVFQAMTQVQDQTVSFVPKIFLLVVMIGLCLPWLTDQMLEFARHSFEKPMTQWAGSSHRSMFPKSKKAADFPQTQSVAFALPSNPLTLQPQNSTEKQTDKPSSASVAPSPRNKLPYVENPKTNGNTPTTPMKSPFILPHYRMSKAPKSRTGG